MIEEEYDVLQDKMISACTLLIPREVGDKRELLYVYIYIVHSYICIHMSLLTLWEQSPR